MGTLDELRAEYNVLTKQLAQPGALHGDAFALASKRAAELTDVLKIAEQVERTRQHLADHEAEAAGDDPELRQVALEELPKLKRNLQRLEAKLEETLTPPDPHAAGGAILEIRAGTGGEEAALFARDLFAMYAKYAERRGWAVRVVSENRSDLGGVKELFAEVHSPVPHVVPGHGNGVYGTLRHESGVHRVQRIPATEKAGRIHTSTSTVAVLPVAAPQDIEIRLEDLRIDTFRAGGRGGQHVQKTESAVRVTHLPTGLVVQCQDERSQHANKERALSVLRSRLLAARLEKEERARGMERRRQIGTGDRSEKIRTYNFAQDRVTDHRIKKSWHGLTGILGGNLDPIVTALHDASLT